MKPFNHDYFLGYVNEITPQYIKIHFPSASLLNKFHYYGTTYAGGNVGNFVVIEDEEYGFLARITKLNLPDSEKKELSEKAIEYGESHFHPSGDAELLLCFSVFEPNKIEKTVSKYPRIGAKVFSCSDEQIQKYVKEFGKKESDEDNVYATLGKLTSNDAECNISLNSLFGRHCAVVGTTGGGKSWTVAKLIEEVTNKTSNKVILIDATGEYEAFDKESCVLGENAYFSFKELSNSEFCFLFREHSPNTSSKLCEAINTLKLIKLKELNDGVKIGKKVLDIEKIISDNSHLLANQDFDISKLSEQIRNECVQSNKDGIYEQADFALKYCSHLISRINMFLQNDTIKKAFGIKTQEEASGIKTQNQEVITIIDKFLSNENNKQILRIGLDKLPYDFSIREIIVDFIAGHLLRKSRELTFKNTPIIFCIDEAHQFLNKRINADDNSPFYLQNIDNIAKESRKYGLFLCLATQMPRDIPVGTLSQMGTFIVHRLINDKDKQAIENAASSANRNVLSFLPVLGEGEALLVGVDFPMPLLLKIGKPKQQPKSNTPRLKRRKNN